MRRNHFVNYQCEGCCKFADYYCRYRSWNINISLKAWGWWLLSAVACARTWRHWNVSYITLLLITRSRWRNFLLLYYASFSSFSLLMCQWCIVREQIFLLYLYTELACSPYGSLRLYDAVNDANETGRGAVQYCYYGTWYSACQYSWDCREANVACRQLGYLGASKKERKKYVFEMMQKQN